MFDLESIVVLLAFVVIAAMLLFLKPLLEERLGAEQLKNLWKWVCIGVQAAEQLFGSGTGERKKEYALNFLDAQGVKADADTLDTLIEAAVRELT